MTQISRPMPVRPASSSGRPMGVSQNETNSAPTVTLDMTPRKAQVPVPRIVYYGPEGSGKTTFGAYGPNPVILAARDEKGVQRLLDSRLIPELPVIDCLTWDQTLAVCDQLAKGGHDRKTVVLDTIGAFENMCQERVCERDFKSDWTETGFMNFQKGFDLSGREWLKLLQRLDVLKSRGITVILLAHARIGKFKNPNGSDFDRYVAKVHSTVWDTTKSWADAVWFVNFHTIVEGDKKRGSRAKGIGGTDRVVYTQRRDTHDAKPGYALPEMVWLSGEPSTHWQELTSYVFNPESNVTQ